MAKLKVSLCVFEGGAVMELHFLKRIKCSVVFVLLATKATTTCPSHLKYSKETKTYFLHWLHCPTRTWHRRNDPRDKPHAGGRLCPWWECPHGSPAGRMRGENWQVFISCHRARCICKQQDRSIQLCSPGRWGFSGGAVCPGRRPHGAESCPTRSLTHKETNSGESPHSSQIMLNVTSLFSHWDVKMTSFQYADLVFQGQPGLWAPNLQTNTHPHCKASQLWNTKSSCLS